MARGAEQRALGTPGRPVPDPTAAEPRRLLRPHQHLGLLSGQAAAKIRVGALEGLKVAPVFLEHEGEEPAFQRRSCYFSVVFTDFFSELEDKGKAVTKSRPSAEYAADECGVKSVS